MEILPKRPFHIPVSNFFEVEVKPRKYVDSAVCDSCKRYSWKWCGSAKKGLCRDPEAEEHFNNSELPTLGEETRQDLNQIGTLIAL